MIWGTLTVLCKGQIKGVLIREGFQKDYDERECWSGTEDQSPKQNSPSPLLIGTGVQFSNYLLLVFFSFVLLCTKNQICIFLITLKKSHLLKLSKHTKLLICKDNSLQTYLSMSSRDNLESRTHNKTKKNCWKN